MPVHQHGLAFRAVIGLDDFQLADVDRADAVVVALRIAAAPATPSVCPSHPQRRHSDRCIRISSDPCIHTVASESAPRSGTDAAQGDVVSH